jgi:hypothetical protein
MPSSFAVSAANAGGAQQSLAQCMAGGLSRSACNSAADVGSGLAIGLIVVVWIVVDFMTALIYGVYRLARRPAR